MEAPPSGNTGAPPSGAAGGSGGPPPPFPNGLPVPPIPFAGPVLIGILFTYLLFGVLLAQIVQWAQTVAKTEKLALKILVAVVVVIQTIHLGFITDNAWTVCVLGFVDPMNLISPPPSAPGTGILNGTVSLCVQMFFVWKIWSLAPKSKKVLAVACLVAALSFTQFGASIGITVRFIQIDRDPARMMFELKVPITVHLISTAACDLLITLSMISILSHYKENTSFIRTKSLLNTLIVATIENGLVTTVTAIGNLVIYFVRKQDMINIAFQYVIGGLYAIVLVTTLNRRQTSTRSDGTTFSLSDANNFVSSRGHGGNFATGRGVASSYQVNVLSSMSDVKAVGMDDDLGNAERGTASKGHQDIMVSVSREVHDDNPYAMSGRGEKR